MIKASAQVLGLAVVAISLACHRSPTAAEFIAEAAKVDCAVNCFSEADYVVASCSAPDPAFTQSISAGRTHYDADKASSCLASLAPTCDSVFPPDDCSSVFTGTLQTGEVCSFFTECASANCGGSTCPFTCQANSAGVGAPCPCDPAFSLTCKNGVCEPLGELNAGCSGDGDCYFRFKCAGGTCSSRVAGDACGPQAACGPGTGLYCDLGASGCSFASCAGTCKPRLTSGSSCLWTDIVVVGFAGFGVDTFSDGNQCAEALTCIGGGFGAVGTCGALSDVGGPCVQASSLASIVVTGCKMGLLCDGGSCKIPPASGPCLQFACDPRVAFCDGEQCSPYLPAGSACSSGGECATGFCQGVIDGDEQGICASCTQATPN
jgi:hypothetical protein